MDFHLFYTNFPVPELLKEQLGFGTSAKEFPAKNETTASPAVIKQTAEPIDPVEKVWNFYCFER